MKRNIAGEFSGKVKFAPATDNSSPHDSKKVAVLEKTIQQKKQSRQFMIFVTEQEEKIFLFVRHFHSICKIVVSDKQERTFINAKLYSEKKVVV
jgi:hypothetical protein